jgi:long-chain acyl-CoA synthetase
VIAALGRRKGHLWPKHKESIMPLVGPTLNRTTPIAGLLGHGLKTKPDDHALVSTTTQMSWRELDELSTRLAAQYLAVGLKPGDRVASLMPNRPALVIHYLACLKAGLVATPLNYRYMPPEIDHALEVSGASLLLHHAERDGDVAASKLGKRLPKGVVRCEANDGRGPHYEELIAGPPTNGDLPTHAPDTPAFIYFTSGSTGKPKGVTHTHATFAGMIACAIQSLELADGDTFLPGSSFSHIGGSLMGLSILAAGGRLIVPRGSEGPEILPLLQQYRPTVLFMLPAALITLVRDHDAGPHDFSSIRLCLSGGDKVSAELEQEFTGLAGFAVDESYGMTEIGIATINPPSGENRLGSIGTICAGFEMSLRDDSGAEASIGTSGRVWVRSPGNTIGYWGNQQATAATIVDGWLDTGDLMRADAEGYLWFCGRKKQVIIHDGSNVCPQEVEEALEAHPAIKEAGVVGVHDLVHGENVRAYVTLREGAKRPKSADVIAFARQRVGYKAPEEIVFLDEMPLNATGKVDRVTLKRLAEDQSHRHLSGQCP